jgi:Na+/H+ antiporter NhaD/arsenite permease-like protein
MAASRTEENRAPRRQPFWLRLGQLLRQDPVLVCAGILGLLSMLLVPPDQEYRHYLDWQVLICLLVLMLAVELFQEARLFAALAAGILSRVGGRRRLTLVLTSLTFLAAMFLTNDVALITLVPLSLLVFRPLEDRDALIRVIVLQTIAANVGSALTPVGNPQNLFLFAHYQMKPLAFLAAAWPVVLTGGLLLAGLIFLLPDRSLQARFAPEAVITGRDLLLACLLFPAAVACVFGLFSEWLLLGAALILLLLLRPRLLTRVDFGLLLTFVFFFLFIGNLSRVPALQGFFAGILEGPQRVLMAGALLSQVISNVPAAILMAGFTDRAGELLRGVNAGGCGTLIASLASVISFKIFSRDGDSSRGDAKKRYLLVFSAYNGLFLAVLLLVSVLAPY